VPHSPFRQRPPRSAGILNGPTPFSCTPRPPESLSGDDIRAFLTHLAVHGHVGPSTQNQALSALVFLFRRVLGRQIARVEGVVHARTPRRIPVVLSRAEVLAVLERMTGVPRLVCSLLYGTGMRLTECLALRVRDIDFERETITVRDGKGAKDRLTLLPRRCRAPLREHLERTRRLHQEDLRRGLGRAPLPKASGASDPGGDRDWAWQCVFPASGHYPDRDTGERHRHHVHQTVIQKAMADAVRLERLTRPATSRESVCAAGALQPVSSGVQRGASPRGAGARSAGVGVRAVGAAVSSETAAARVPAPP
jgi:integrase